MEHLAALSAHVRGELSKVIIGQDEVFAQSCLTHAGAIKHEPTAKLVEGT